MKGVFDDLKLNRGLNKATEIVLSGCSAGGAATYLHSDYIADYLVNDISTLRKISVLSDSGYFLKYDGGDYQIGFVLFFICFLL